MIDLTTPTTMATDDVPVVDVSSGPAASESSAPMAEVGKYVVSHPALCFASAFVVGVTCAWWLKQA